MVRIPTHGPPTHPGAMLLKGSVGKIEPGHIHAGRHQAGQDIAVTGRSQGAHNLGPSLVTQHGRVPPRSLRNLRGY